MSSAPLRQSITLVQATAMVVGTIIGASIFVQPSVITGAVPIARGVMLVWICAGALTLCGSLICAELSSAFASTGGVYIYLKESVLAGGRIFLGMGDVLGDAHRHHRGHRDGRRAVRRLLRRARRHGHEARCHRGHCRSIGDQLARREAG
ncbi:MAG: amino acid permease [Gemmatimonadota bacterium]|nr:amino acid permease [Gemmatimonadota bacterium]